MCLADPPVEKTDWSTARFDERRARNRVSLVSPVDPYAGASVNRHFNIWSVFVSGSGIE